MLMVLVPLSAQSSSCSLPWFNGREEGKKAGRTGEGRARQGVPIPKARASSEGRRGGRERKHASELTHICVCTHVQLPAQDYDAIKESYTRPFVALWNI